MASAIITFPVRKGRRIGTLLGELGAATPANSDWARQLAALSPAQARRKMQSLLQSLNVELVEDYRLEYPQEGGIRRVPVSRHMVGDGVSDSDLARLARFMVPPTVEQCEAWLAELSVIAPSRAEGEMTGALKLQAYVRRLRGYPADIVRSVLLERAWRFFPSWAELAGFCESAAKDRRELLDLADACRRSGPRRKALPAWRQIKRQRAGQQPRIAAYRDQPVPKERGSLPFLPDPSPAPVTLQSLKDELAEIDAMGDEPGLKDYRAKLVARLAHLTTDITQEAG